MVANVFAINPFQYPLFQAIDADGNPISGGLIYTYEAGTTTPKVAYADRALTIPASNPIVLDSKGEALFYLSGSYKINLKTAADVQVDGFPIDNLVDGPEVVFDNMVDLRAATPLAENQKITLLGRDDAGDGGWGQYYWDPNSILTDNTGTVIQPDTLPASGRWLRLDSESTSAAVWGGIVDAISGIGSDDHRLIINTAQTALFAPLTIPSNIEIDWNKGFPLDTNGNLLTINCKINAGQYQIFITDITSTRPAAWRVLGDCVTDWFYPEWFGATGEGIATEGHYIQQAIELTTGSSKPDIYVSDGTYLVEAEANDVHINGKCRMKLGPNAILKAQTAVSSVYKILYIAGNHDVVIDGGNFVGERLDHVTEVGESGHCISISVDANNVTVKNATMTEARGDGIYVNGCYDVILENNIIHNNRRNNVSLVGDLHGVWIKDNVIYNANGTNPQAGIDLEPNNTRLSQKIFVLNNEIYNNLGAGLSLTELGTGELLEIIISGNQIYDSSEQIKFNGCNNVNITGNVLMGGNGLYSTTADDVTNVSITGNTIEGISMDMTALNTAKITIDGNNLLAASTMKNITALIFSNNTQTGYVNIEACPQVIVQGNNIEGLTFKGLWVTDTNKGIISGNYVTIPENYSGIEVENCNNFSISTNHIFNCGEAGMKLTSCDRNAITGNTFHGNDTSGNDTTQLFVDNSDYNSINGNVFSALTLTTRTALEISGTTGASNSNLVTSNHWGDTAGFTDGGVTTTAANNISD